MRSMGSQESNLSSCGKLRLWTDCVDARTDFNLRCAHMPTFPNVGYRLKWNKQKDALIVYKDITQLAEIEKRNC